MILGKSFLKSEILWMQSSQPTPLDNDAVSVGLLHTPVSHPFTANFRTRSPQAPVLCFQKLVLFCAQEENGLTWTFSVHMNIVLGTFIL